MYVLSMGSEKSRIYDKLQEKNAKRIEHLLLLYFFRNDEWDKNGWITDLYKTQIYVPRRSFSGKWLTKEFIRKAIWDDKISIVFKQELPGDVEDLSRKMSGGGYEPVALTREDVDGCFMFCRDYHDWLAGRLFTGKSLQLEEVRDKINELLSMY